MKTFGVVGHPIEHSKSPEIHRLFAAQCGKEIEYFKHDIDPENFGDFVKDFFAQGGTGLNVTVPFKEEAYRLSVPANKNVELSQAVNTLYRNHRGQIAGDNTDGPGLVKDLTRHGFELTNKHVLILGAGGAVRGILPSLIEQNPQSICVANRTLAKAERLKDDFADTFSLDVSQYESISPSPVDVIINGTSLGLQGKLPNITNKVIGRSSRCYDLMYSAKDTAFVSWCLANEAVVAVDGLGMLVEQAAVSFKIWLEAEPKTSEVIAALRQR